MRRTPIVVVLACALALASAGGAQAAVDRSIKLRPGQRADWNGASVQAVTNYYYWDPVGAGNVGPFTSHTCTKERTSYCEQILVEFVNPLTKEEIDGGKTAKLHPVTVWINGFSAPQGPVNDFDLLVYESDAAGTRGTEIAYDGNLQNTTKELVTFDLETTVSEPSRFFLIDVVYYQVVNGRYSGHITV